MKEKLGNRIAEEMAPDTRRPNLWELKILTSMPQ